MYLCIDVGGTKTFVAELSAEGQIIQQFRFPTPKEYSTFLSDIKENVDKVTSHQFKSAGIGLPAVLDRDHGIALAFANLPWRNVPVQADLEAALDCPVAFENDANLAGLSEAMLLPDYDRVLYVTISTGIGSGFIVKRRIDPGLADSEAGHMKIEHHGKMVDWESFASGRAMVERYHKMAADIKDKATWQEICRDLAKGFIQLIALSQPDVIVIGGSVGTHFSLYGDMLSDELKRYETPIVPIPPLRQAKRPEEAVVYGCYDLIKQTYG